MADTFLSLVCPHCGGDVIVHPNELHCKIFRHAVYKANNEQINPHMPKSECDSLAAGGLIHGCGKPFKVENNQAVACDYI